MQLPVQWLGQAAEAGRFPRQHLLPKGIKILTCGTWQEEGNPFPRRDTWCRLVHTIPLQHQSNHYINLPGCCSHVPPLPLLLKENKVGIVSLFYHMIELMNGMCAQCMPSLSMWDLCTEPVTPSAKATTKYLVFPRNPVQFEEPTAYRCEPLSSHTTSSDETAWHVSKQKPCLFYK